ncbi:MAG TPA: tetratricopeptide repeat protein [Prolixibacteraceae bacterium]|nr:tetratricopeptide repeat protein [Prolixibacteraceae bacterium]
MKNAIKRYSLLLLIVVSCLVSQGQSAAVKDSVSAANQLYNTAKYQDAIRKYQYVISQGFESSELYFNLGNAFYKLGNATYAILNYERAKKLAPNDDDVRYNLELARTLIVDNVVSLPDGGFLRWMKQMISSKSINFWGIFSIITFFSFLFLFGLFLLSRTFSVKRLAFWFSVAAISVSAITFTFGSTMKSKLVNHKSAVITDRSVKVKSSPSETGTELFIVHEGVTVQLTDKLGDWVNISLPDGNKGWVKEESMIRI